MTTPTKFDYIIVGAGSAGCVLAARLSEAPDTTVLLLEAGGWDNSPWIHLPLGWGRLQGNRKKRFDWGLETEPEPRLDSRRIECARGKVIGGCSSVNAMAYVRGHASDYDRWAAYGLPGWSYAEVLNYFRRQEAWADGASRYRGGDGPIATCASRYADPLVDAWLTAARSAGHACTPDYNGAQQEGFGPLQMTIGRGRRASAASGYLRPALERGNLTVWTGALVQSITFRGERADGVACLVNGAARQVSAAQEVILAAGAIHSPQILMLSGIGPPASLQRHGIGVRVALPGVGKNLQDHLWASVEYERASPGLFLREMRLDKVGLGIMQGLLFKKGFWTDMPSGWTAFLKTRTALQLPDIQLLFRALPAGAGPWLPPFSKPVVDGFACRAVMLRPQSTGRIELASADIRDLPKIHFDFLQTETDRGTLRAGVRLIRELAGQPALRSFIKRELAPGPAMQSDQDLDRHIARTSATSHHPAGTCKMGAASDPTAVLDHTLRVRGVERLRVVDASAMPDLVGGNINAAVLMIAEKAADLIKAARATHATRTPNAPEVADHELESQLHTRQYAN